MGVRLSVVLKALLVQIERQFGNLLIGQLGIAGVENLAAGCLMSMGR